MILPGIGKIVEGINSVNSAIDSDRAEKVIFLESDKTTSHRLALLIKKAKNKGLIVEKISKKIVGHITIGIQLLRFVLPKRPMMKKVLIS